MVGLQSRAMTKSKLTEAQLQAWAVTRVRMLVARLVVLLVQGVKL
jgi:hypothetical protein